MAENSKIEWTHHTFNPWRGCTKVSAGCANCYAEKLSHRNPKTLGIWGDNGTRVIASESAWKEPLRWNRLAAEVGERHRVFCASLADVFEDRPDLIAPRTRLFSLIDTTPNLDWLLLTKRPENIARLMPEKVVHENRPVFPGCPGVLGKPMPCIVTGGLRRNVWLGVSVEDQQRADERIPWLLKTPAAVRFLSCEPLLGPINLSVPWEGEPTLPTLQADWVIVGGESGPRSRPCNIAHVHSIVEQCEAADVACFVKQLGAVVEQDGSADRWGVWPDCVGWTVTGDEPVGDELLPDIRSDGTMLPVLF